MHMGNKVKGGGGGATGPAWKRSRGRLGQRVASFWDGFHPVRWRHLVVACAISATVGGLATQAIREIPVTDGASRLSEAMAEGLTYGETVGWDGSLPRRGEARILALRVSFPGIGEGDRFAPGDDADALQALIGRHIDGTISDGATSEFPYESLYAYYLRSSYGQLMISGEAYDHVAEHPRDWYADDPTTLFAEAMAELDDEVDYADFDGDGDGTIDCVAIRFEGPSEGHGSTWWSQVFHSGFLQDGAAKLESSVPRGAEFDGKRIDSLMLLHHPSDDGSACATFIHECGHALGLPDYYASTAVDKEDKGDDFVPGGIGTYDMMSQNQGDHNAFSKWMLGWLDDSDIVRVTCDEHGDAVAMRGGESLPTDEKGRVNIDLSGISSESLGGQAKAIAIYPMGNDGEMGPLTDFYLLQYDSFEGNQTVHWGSQTWVRDLTGGFRLFRVQATPCGSWDGLGHSNKTDRQHDQLIELVDPDNPGGDAWHVAHSPKDIVPTAMRTIKRFGAQPVPRDGRYGCSLHVGDKVTPDTVPSTNFREDAATGRTGIALKVTRSDDDGGTVRICYVPE